jgi:alcohol dehydrogenase (cytochrome c)
MISKTGGTMRIRSFTHSLLLGTAVAFSVLSAPAVHAQSAQQLIDDTKTPGDVLTYGMGYGQQRFSQLKQINSGNVKRMTPVWSYSLNNAQGQESHPIITDGVMYVTTHTDTMAIDAMTGKQIWKTNLEYAADVPKMACCGLVNRGVAMYEGRIFRTTLDAHVQALDPKTGKQLWKSKAADYKFGYSMTVAPLIANGVLITGISGGEYGTRGFIDGWDPATGKQLWRRYTTAAPGEKGGDTWPGDTAMKGGAPTWLTGSYDPALDLVYWGTGNAGPWNAEFRKGDNLYTNTVLAMRPKTGEIVWHYQFSPNDPYDYDGVNELVHADMKFGGEMKKVIMQANRNGFFYVIDRTNGKLLAANQFAKKVNWAERIDLTTGRPVPSEIDKKARAGEKIELWPSAFGGKNWMPMSYNPGTGLVYANTLNIAMPYKMIKPEYTQGEWYLGIEFTGFSPGPDTRGYLSAIDPATGKTKWEMPWPNSPSFSGTMTTAGGLVFTGAMTGEFMALDAKNGKKLWQFQTGSGIIGQPVTWERNGTQYVTVVSGSGGVYYLSGDERLANIPGGGSVWTFALTK